MNATAGANPNTPMLAASDLDRTRSPGEECPTLLALFSRSKGPPAAAPHGPRRQMNFANFHRSDAACVEKAMACEPDGDATHVARLQLRPQDHAAHRHACPSDLLSWHDREPDDDE